LGLGKGFLLDHISFLLLEINFKKSFRVVGV